MKRWANFESREHGHLARQIRHNLWIFTALTGMGLVRVGFDWPATGHWVLAPLALAMVVLAGATRLPLDRLAARSWIRPVMAGAYVAALGALALFAAGDPEPTVMFATGAMVTMVAASTTSGVRDGLGVGAAGVAGLLIMMALFGGDHGYLNLTLLIVMATMTALCAFTTHNRRLQQEQRDEIAYRTSALLENGSDAILAVNAAGVGYVSSSSGRVLGHEGGELTLDSLTAMIHPDERERVSAFLTELAAAPARHTARIESRSRHRDGDYLDVEVIGTNHLADPLIGALILTVRDVSTQKALRGELDRQAISDPLTGLPNRALLRDRIGSAVRRHTRTAGRVSLLLIDLDDFKKVNDTLGHLTGDEFLLAQARRMAAAVRPGDTLARLGGDEFAVLVEDLDEIGLHTLAQRLLAAVHEPVRLGDSVLTGGASIGIATVKAGESSDIDLTDELIRDADLAMYAAKKAGRDRAVTFEESMYQAAVAEAEARTELERALDRNEFVVVYQPIVDLPSGLPIGVEALVRWQHPERGLLGPNEFIAHAERTGLIVPLGAGVLRVACQEMARWHREIPGAAAMRVSVNLSARQFQEPGLVDMVREVLAETGIAPEKVVLEITESMAMEDVDATVLVLHRLRDLGVRLAIDDFGTGYSSLSYLSRFPIDILKIDKAFVDGITANREDAALAEAVVGLGRALRLQTVAEGIEQADQQSLLTGLGCTYGQGYLFARPISADEITAMLREMRADS
ncbi:putative bifunctional diguanylate cyclase/phosphodiesterase [Actinoplanes couchii]|uniref:putative bifunctional diguanylate cyclase/phosphodiesterase n=1 Tax=Actinoplanes couchii TaxID=403638 RepID=UPI001941D72A|nr:GGDEF domain-containing phosphodiesterase [Actinoplanes couchii]MDR6317335.1 diguanylate cyclase (GGDEF)-like protein/PAS domain S-box-containing protein [Actinoplanes couchii]